MQETQEKGHANLFQTPWHEFEAQILVQQEVDIKTSNLLPHLAVSSFPINVKAENPDNDVTSPCRNGVCASSSADVSAVTVQCEAHHKLDVDELDHIPLQTIKMRISSRISVLKCSKKIEPLSLERNNVESPNQESAVSLKRHRQGNPNSDSILKKCSAETPLQVDVLGSQEDAFVGDYAYCAKSVDAHSAGKVKDPSHPVSDRSTEEGYEERVSGRNADKYPRGSTAKAPSNDIAGSSGIDKHAAVSSFSRKVKVKNSDDDSVLHMGGLVGGISSCDVQAVKVDSKTHNDFDVDKLDHIPLLERLHMLLLRMVSDLGNSGGWKYTKRTVPSALSCGFSDSSKPKASGIARKAEGCSMETAAGKDALGFMQDVSVGESTQLRKNIRKSVYVCSTGGGKDQCNLVDIKCLEEALSTSKNPETNADNAFSSSAVLNNRVPSFPIRVKVENIENDTTNLCKDLIVGFSSFDQVAVDAKTEIYDELSVDGLDHLPLQDRINMLLSSKLLDFGNSSGLECSTRTGRRDRKCDSVGLLDLKKSGLALKRKRKKTVTSSAETALEEDAPGLLQVLIESGINIDEIRLYEDMENEDALEMCADEDSFVELEAVISQLFSQRPLLLKLARLRNSKGSRPSYCLACLVSLIEQTRSLQFHKWPVEWGWCRDLLSFIFVFERHNRIVLERPEYGYATYFFELVESLPIKWQIKRLVTAMKLTSCSRATLVENKSLLVGEDLTEGEARVLEEYGWRPNTGLGSMLNYCDRVVHDRKKEDRVSDWRSKIGKLLMDGYDQGTIVTANLPKKVIEYNGYHKIPQVKVEL